MPIGLTAKIAPKNEAFTGMVDADQVLGGGDSGTLPDGCIAASNVTQHQGSIDHGSIAGLADDDHTQYHTDARGDARYYTESEHIDTSAGAGDAGKPIKLDAAGKISGTMLIKGEYAKTVAPTVNDDSDDGYGVGSWWFDTTADRAYVCLDATATAAVWVEVGIPETEDSGLVVESPNVGDLIFIRKVGRNTELTRVEGWVTSGTGSVDFNIHFAAEDDATPADSPASGSAFSSDETLTTTHDVFAPDANTIETHQKAYLEITGVTGSVSKIELGFTWSPL